MVFRFCIANTFAVICFFLGKELTSADTNINAKNLNTLEIHRSAVAKELIQV